MPRPLVYLIYNLLLPVILIIGFPAFIIKGIRRGGLARNFRQRFGFFRADDLHEVSEHENGPIWFHAVSVGEVFLALKAINALQSIQPTQKLILSTTTTTGFSVASEQVSSTLKVIHNPIDLPWITASVLRRVQPAALVLIEAEIWPNLVAQLSRRNIPVLLANARLSPRSARRYSKFRALIEPIFSQLTAISVPFEADIRNWEDIGIPRERVQVLGSVKFDSASLKGGEKVEELRQWLHKTGCPEKSRILLAGSTHDGEESLIAENFLRLREDFPSLTLVIVPRHAERAANIVAQLEEQEIFPIVKVPFTGGTPAVSQTKRVPIVWIANTTGELRSWFDLAELVVIGKSFCGTGGQNPVEPIQAGKPVIVGPHMENFPDVVKDLKEHEGLRQVSKEDLYDALHEFLEKPEKGKTQAEKGRKALAHHKGASIRTAKFILAHTGEQGS